MKSKTKKSLILLGFILLKLILHYTLISPEYDLHRDEYLHLDQGSHLAWGFVSVPPVTSWFAYVIHLLGDSVFWVKFFPGLFGALTMIVVWKTIEVLKGNLYALILGSVCVLFSALLRLNILFQPNSMDVLCWTLFYYILIRYFQSERKKWLYLAAAVAALGILNKYNFAFLLLGIFPAILITPQRKLLAKKETYVALLLGILLISSNLIWQYQNAFPVFHHLKELEETQLVNVNRMDFLKGQILFFIGALVVIIAGVIGLWRYPSFKNYRSFFWSLLFTLGIFMYFKAKDYYAIGIYPIYIAFGSVYLARLLDSGWKRYLKPVLIAIPILLFIPISQIAFPNKSPQYVMEHPETYKKLGLLRWEDGKDHRLPQDFADMQGWKELAQKVDIVCDKFPKQEQTLILCDNYGQAGAINYYTKNKKIKAVSFNADYINWFELDNKIDNFIRVKEFEGRGSEMKDTAPFFGTGFVADSIANPLAREYKTTIFVFRKPKVDINKRLQSEVEEAHKYH